MDNNFLSQYLLQRGLFDTRKIIDSKNQSTEDDILADDQLLAEVAGMFKGHEKALSAIIRARIEPIAKEMVMSSVPQETIVLRQSILEVALIFDDMEKYAGEYERRTKAMAEDKEKAGEANTSLDNGEPDNGASKANL